MCYITQENLNPNYFSALQTEYRKGQSSMKPEKHFNGVDYGNLTCVMCSVIRYLIDSYLRVYALITLCTSKENKLHTMPTEITFDRRRLPTYYVNCTFTRKSFFNVDIQLWICVVKVSWNWTYRTRVNYTCPYRFQVRLVATKTTEIDHFFVVVTLNALRGVNLNNLLFFGLFVYWYLFHIIYYKPKNA